MQSTGSPPRALASFTFLVPITPALSSPHRAGHVAARKCSMSSDEASKLSFTKSAKQNASYDEVVVKPLAGPFFEVLRRLSPPAPGEACLDVATGTGPVAFRVAALVGPSVRFSHSGCLPKVVCDFRSAPDVLTRYCSR